MAYHPGATLLTAFVLSSVHCGATACNENTFTDELTVCLQDLDRFTDFKQGPVTSDRIDLYCSSKAEQDISCAENVINSCRDTSATTRRILDKSIDINAVRRSVRIVCNNSAVVDEQQGCIAKYDDGVNACLEVASQNHEAQLTIIAHKAPTKGMEWFEEKTYESLCDFTEDVNDCIRPYGQNCGRRVDDLFDALVLAVTPPVCSAAAQTYANLVGSIYLVVMAILTFTF